MPVAQAGGEGPGKGGARNQHSVRAKGRQTQRSDSGIVSIGTAIGPILLMRSTCTVRLLQAQSRLLQKWQNTFAEVREVGQEIEETELYAVYASFFQRDELFDHLLRSPHDLDVSPNPTSLFLRTILSTAPCV